MSQLDKFLPCDENARIMMRWWWFGPTITHDEIERELRLMHEAGIGGVEVAYLYPVTTPGEHPTTYPFLSQTFLDALQHAGETAKRLGMTFDITLGSGWPYGGPHITPALKARKLKLIEIPLEAGATRYDVDPQYAEAETVYALCEGETLECKGTTITLAAPLDTPATLRALISMPTGQAVKRAARGAEGHALDHYSEAALKAHFEALGKPLLKAAGQTVRAIFCDSLEAYESNWTPALFEEFIRLRGYDLRPHMPAILAALELNPEGNMRLREDAPENIGDLLHDYSQTLQDLLEERFLQPLTDFANAHQTACRVQVYGVPPTTLSTYRYVDIPEGETTLGDSDICLPADWTELTPIRFAAAASKHYGKPLVSSETWTRLHSPPYAATPLDMKAEADQFFLQGTNQIIGHGWCQHPQDGDPSQWVFYAAANFNETNPWHNVMPELTGYMQRICSLMRQGEPVADVALYLPDRDIMSRRTFSPEKVNLNHVKSLRDYIGTALGRKLLAAGLNFHLIDDRALLELTQNNCFDYGAIILPKVTQVPLSTMRALTQLAESGVSVIALESIPTRAPGLAAQAQDSAEVATLANALFEKDAASARCYDSVDALALSALPQPDVALAQDKPRIGYVHRKQDGADTYFFANTSNERITFSPRFRDSSGRFTWVKPLSGQTAQTGLGEITLEAFESIIAVQQYETAAAPPSNHSPAPATDIPLDGPWTLHVPDRDFTRQLDQLQPWTDFAELEDFSGQGVYRCVFTVPNALPDDATTKLQLHDSAPLPAQRYRPERRNFGFSVFIDSPVMDAAEVWLNGTLIGRLFAPPFELDLTPALRQGENQLEIKVTNRLVNQLAHTMLYDFSAVHQAYGKRMENLHDIDNLCTEPAGLKGHAWVNIQT